MNPHPQHVGDLMLAPVAIAVDARLEELGESADEELDYQIVLDVNADTSIPEQRGPGVVTTVTALTELYGWVVDLVNRGVRLLNGEHTFTLGMPEHVGRFLRC